MTSSSFLAGPLFSGFRKTLAAALGSVCLVLAACGGSADAPPPPESGPSLPVAPTITQQPVDLTVTAGQPASFTVAATGTAPLAYQWQRNGVDIAGATTTTYTIAATVLGDSGAVFRAVVTNVAGSATSNNATLTVTMSAPVLTITQQPASTSVVAGTQASFTVAATCSSGTLDIQWQRSADAGLTWTNIVGATTTVFSLTTVIGDNGAQFRAMLDCSAQSATPSNAATLTVTPPGGVTLALLPLAGLRDQADIAFSTGIDQDAAGSFTFIANNLIKRLSADLSTITLVAGQGSGSADGPAATASFNQPFALTQDAAGNIYVADTSNSTIRRIGVDGMVSTLAGLAGSPGIADGTGSAARFDRPAGIALGPDGDLYVADNSRNLIRRVTTAGVVTTYAGDSNGSGFLDGAPLTAKFSSPFGVAVAANGDVLVADSSNNRVRRIVRSGNVAGSVETLAGNGTFSAADPDGVGVAAVISQPHALVARGNTLTVRDDAGLLRQIDLTTKAVTTLTGSRTLGEGFADGSTTTARVRDIGLGLTNAANGGFMLADDLALRSVSATGVVKTIASSGAAGITPQGIGTLPQMPFALASNDPQGAAVDPAGNVVISDFGTRVVRRIGSGGVVTLAAGLTGGFEGAVDGIGSEAQFPSLGFAIASDPAGVLYVADNSGLRRIGTDNATTQLAGSFTAFGAVDGNGASARFNRIFGLAAGSGGVVYAADAGNNAVRRIDAAGNVTTYAGVMGQPGSVDGPIATARFSGPRSVALAPDGSLYVADNGLRRISADGSTVSTIAAAGNLLEQIAIDSAGTVYYSNQNGLYMLQNGVSTLLIPITHNNTVLGTNPKLALVLGLAVLGPKQLVILGASEILLATLP
jgi:sugar lactone lactonase YvrE